jgi:FMN phosphatase YigB (HAD superfamily)
MTKPSVFIGSSSEGLNLARAVRSLLARDAEITLWNEGFFALGNTFIETLVNSLPRFDFAILVLTPDDLVTSRAVESFGPRDNVLFELGLFMGRLGRSRAIILHQAGGAIKVPSDLSGVTTATYEWPREDGSHKSAVGAACDSIREMIRDLGVASSRTKANGSRLIGRRGDPEAKDAMLRIINGATHTSDGFLCIAGVANKELFGPIDSERTLWPAVQALLQARTPGREPAHHVRVTFLDPESEAAHARGIFETRPDRPVPVNTPSLIRTLLDQARSFRRQHPNLHIRLTPEAPCYLFFNQEEMLYHPYLTSTVGPDTEVCLARQGSKMYDYGVRHFESYWQGRWVLFDLGNVLVGFEHGHVSKRLEAHLAGAAASSRRTKAEIHSFFFDARGDKPSRNQLMDLGRYTIEQLAAEFRAWSSCTIDLAAFQGFWDSIFAPVSSEALGCIQELQRMGIRVGICSNTNKSHWEWVSGQYGDLVRGVNGQVLSYLAHVCKPDRKFYDQVFAMTNVPACNHLLIDDLKENVLGARAVGMCGKVFTSFPEVLELVQDKFWDSRYPGDRNAP